MRIETTKPCPFVGLGNETCIKNMMSQEMSNRLFVLSANFKLESLILAQDERWRRA